MMSNQKTPDPHLLARMNGKLFCFDNLFPNAKVIKTYGKQTLQTVYSVSPPTFPLSPELPRKQSTISSTSSGPELYDTPPVPEKRVKPNLSKNDKGNKQKAALGEISNNPLSKTRNRNINAPLVKQTAAAKKVAANAKKKSPAKKPAKRNNNKTNNPEPPRKKKKTPKKKKKESVTPWFDVYTGGNIDWDEVMKYEFIVEPRNGTPFRYPANMLPPPTNAEENPFCKDSSIFEKSPEPRVQEKSHETSPKITRLRNSSPSSVQQQQGPCSSPISPSHLPKEKISFETWSKKRTLGIYQNDAAPSPVNEGFGARNGTEMSEDIFPDSTPLSEIASRKGNPGRNDKTLSSNVSAPEEKNSSSPAHESTQEFNAAAAKTSALPDSVNCLSETDMSEDIFPESTPSSNIASLTENQRRHLETRSSKILASNEKNCAATVHDCTDEFNAAATTDALDNSLEMSEDIFPESTPSSNIASLTENQRRHHETCGSKISASKDKNCAAHDSTHEINAAATTCTIDSEDIFADLTPLSDVAARKINPAQLKNFSAGTAHESTHKFNAAATAVDSEDIFADLTPLSDVAPRKRNPGRHFKTRGSKISASKDKNCAAHDSIHEFNTAATADALNNSLEMSEDIFPESSPLSNIAARKANSDRRYETRSSKTSTPKEKNCSELAHDGDNSLNCLSGTEMSEDIFPESTPLSNIASHKGNHAGRHLETRSSNVTPLKDKRNVESTVSLKNRLRSALSNSNNSGSACSEDIHPLSTPLSKSENRHKPGGPCETIGKENPDALLGEANSSSSVASSRTERKPPSEVDDFKRLSLECQQRKCRVVLTPIVLNSRPNQGTYSASLVDSTSTRQLSVVERIPDSSPLNLEQANEVTDSEVIAEIRSSSVTEDPVGVVRGKNVLPRSNSIEDIPVRFSRGLRCFNGNRSHQPGKSFTAIEPNNSLPTATVERTISSASIESNESTDAAIQPHNSLQPLSDEKNRTQRRKRSSASITGVGLSNRTRFQKSSIEKYPVRTIQATNTIGEPPQSLEISSGSNEISDSKVNTERRSSLVTEDPVDVVSSVNATFSTSFENASFRFSRRLRCVNRNKSHQPTDTFTTIEPNNSSPTATVERTSSYTSIENNALADLEAVHVQSQSEEPLLDEINRTQRRKRSSGSIYRTGLSNRTRFGKCSIGKFPAQSTSGIAEPHLDQINRTQRRKRSSGSIPVRSTSGIAEPHLDEINRTQSRKRSSGSIDRPGLSNRTRIEKCSIGKFPVQSTSGIIAEPHSYEMNRNQNLEHSTGSNESSDPISEVSDAERRSSLVSKEPVGVVRGKKAPLSNSIENMIPVRFSKRQRRQKTCACHCDDSNRSHRNTKSFTTTAATVERTSSGSIEIKASMVQSQREEPLLADMNRKQSLERSTKSINRAGLSNRTRFGKSSIGKCAVNIQKLATNGIEETPIPRLPSNKRSILNIREIDLSDSTPGPNRRICRKSLEQHQSSVSALAARDVEPSDCSMTNESLISQLVDLHSPVVSRNSNYKMKLRECAIFVTPLAERFSLEQRRRSTPQTPSQFVRQSIRNGNRPSPSLTVLIDESLRRSSIGSSQASTLSSPAASPRRKVLNLCSEHRAVHFRRFFKERQNAKCSKLSEGLFSEVFCIGEHPDSSILKIMPVNGSHRINDVAQKTFKEIFSEIVMTLELSKLSTGFVQVNGVHCTYGKYPKEFLHEWMKFTERKETENENPDVLDEKQHFIVLDVPYGGVDLEVAKFKNAKEVLSVFQQIVLSLAVAEEQLEFEHRDLHWGNVLIKPCQEGNFSFNLDQSEKTIPSYGQRVTIIDCTLSRFSKDGVTLFCDLASEEFNYIFEGQGDYQFDIYRNMKEANGNNWKTFEPVSNVFWLDYILEKLLKHKVPKSARRSKEYKTLCAYRRTLKSFSSAKHFVGSMDI